MRSFAALSVVLAASSAVLASPSPNVSLNPRDLIARQTVGPTTCQSQCAPVTDQMTKCGTDLTCMCGSGVASAYYGCLQCGYGVADASMKDTLQQGWAAYLDGCKSVGMTVSQSPTLTGSSSSSSSSSSNSNNNPNTNSNTNSNTGSSGLNGSNSSGNDASRSTSLGFIGLGALAFAVSSLF